MPGVTRLISILSATSLLCAGCAAGVPDESDGGTAPPVGSVIPPVGQPPPAPPVEDPPPEVPPPPDMPVDRCAGIDAQGLCRGDIAVWCEDGVLRNVDCRTIDAPCDWNPTLNRYYCFDGVLPPDAGVVAPPPEDPPPEDPPPEDPPPLPPPQEEEPLPPPQDICMGVTERGECRGTVSVVCVDGEELVFFDCAILGLQCVDLFFVFGCGQAM